MSSTPDWPPGPAHARLSPGTVDVWRLDLASVHAAHDTLVRLLDETETARAALFRYHTHRRRFIARRGLLRYVLARYVQLAPDRLRFAVGTYGKPVLCTPPGTALRFSLSHSDDCALLAVTAGREIGVDVERVRPEFATESIPEQFFSSAEVRELRALPPAAQPLGFFLAWTRKEAYVKARGQGLSLPLDSFDVTLAPGRPAALLATRPVAEDARRWAVHALAPAPDYVGALVVESRDSVVRCWSLLRGG